ncbi:MAG: hypothetical protein LUH63_06065 [Parabacteroides sp.]|nr:hypothetical protein [Parabacteroides sp.]
MAHIIFVTLSILGTFLFQGYWLWNSYRIENKQFRSRINETLQQAINEDLTNRMEALEKDTTPDAPHGMIEFSFALDSTSHASSGQNPGKPTAVLS